MRTTQNRYALGEILIHIGLARGLVWARYERQHRISAQALEYYRLDVEYPHDPC